MSIKRGIFNSTTKYSTVIKKNESRVRSFNSQRYLTYLHIAKQKKKICNKM